MSHLMPDQNGPKSPWADIFEPLISFHLSISLSIAAAFPFFLLASFSCGIASLLVRPALRLLIGWFDVGGLICLNAGGLYKHNSTYWLRDGRRPNVVSTILWENVLILKLWIYGATMKSTMVINSSCWNLFVLLVLVRGTTRHVRSVRQSNIETTVCIAIKILWSSLVFSNSSISLLGEINAVVTMTLVYVDGDACLV